MWKAVKRLPASAHDNPCTILAQYWMLLHSSLMPPCIVGFYSSLNCPLPPPLPRTRNTFPSKSHGNARLISPCITCTCKNSFLAACVDILCQQSIHKKHRLSPFPFLPPPPYPPRPLPLPTPPSTQLCLFILPPATWLILPCKVRSQVVYLLLFIC